MILRRGGEEERRRDGHFAGTTFCREFSDYD
jgi:hypothetical protein